MYFSNIELIRKQGFEGFHSINDLRNNPKLIPIQKGVYLILYPEINIPNYLEKGTGGYFKGKNPNVPAETLRLKWIQESTVLYIGKATNLHSRLKQYFNFGSGKNVGHYGGRYIWQLLNSQNLLVCWMSNDIQDPRLIEKDLIQKFKSQFGNRPFANLAD